MYLYIQHSKKFDDTFHSNVPMWIPDIGYNHSRIHWNCGNNVNVTPAEVHPVHIDIFTYRYLCYNII